MINQDRYRKERLALTGIIVVVILLLAYCIGTLIVLWQTSTQINQNVHLLDMYQEAHYLARAEDSVADEYYLNSGHLFQQEYYSNVTDLTTLLTTLAQQDPANRAFILSLQQAQNVYVSRTTRYFSMVDVRHPLARSFYNTLVDPLAADLNARLLNKVKAQSVETRQLLVRNQMLQQTIALLCILFFILGSGMLVLFGRNILRYRQDLASARQVTWELTIEKQAEEAERRAQTELDRKKDEFVCMASHELRTPLTSLKGNLQLAQRRLRARLDGDTGSLSETEQALFEHLTLWNERALRQVNVGCRLVNDLLDVNQIRTEGLHVALSTDNLVQVVRHAVDDMRVMAQDHPLHFETPASPEISARIDRVRIGQVVTHYTSNAFRYSDEQQPVLVGIKLEGDEARVWVKDAGPGLSLEAQCSLWDRFQQFSGHMGYTTPGSCGLGLGLYLCQEIVRLHGGRIGVESVIGVGSTFWFTLPIIRPGEYTY